MAWRLGAEADETGELAGAIRSQRIARARRALANARAQLQKAAAFLPEGMEGEVGGDGPSLQDMDEALAGYVERLGQAEAGGEG